MPRKPTASSSPSDSGGRAKGHQRPRKRAIRQTKADDDLLEVLESGDEQAYITLLYLYFNKKLKSFLSRQVTVDYRDEIDDMLQEAFLNFYRMVKKHREKQIPLSRPFNHYDYLCAVLRNEYIERRNRRMKMQLESLTPDAGVEEQEGTMSVEDKASLQLYDPQELERNLLRKELRDFIEDLDEPYRTVMRLRSEDLGEKEIADLMKCSENLVKTWVHRGKEKLRNRYQENQEKQARQRKEVQ